MRTENPVNAQMNVELSFETPALRTNRFYLVGFQSGEYRLAFGEASPAKATRCHSAVCFNGDDLVALRDLLTANIEAAGLKSPEPNPLEIQPPPRET